MTSYNIYSWNVNGIRAVLRKGGLQNLLDSTNPDILCIQETKAKQGQAEIDLPEYEELWNSAKRPGYSGTAIFTKPAPLSVFSDFTDDIKNSHPWQDDSYGDPLSEGRILTAEYEQFFLVNVYTPNSKRELTRLSLRHKLWDPAFLEFLKQLEQTKPVVVCGDFNAAHTEIDLARPKDNLHNAGFTPEERQGIENYLTAGLIDTFRTLHPDEQRYTWWVQWANARANNIGWRIDYFFISKVLLPHLKSAEIHEDILGSDHCPISIRLEF
ncbi:exodeoxyribonuclease III [Candidatus Saccharibacteria bacterium]|nr:exodeoxyribonuclease III [Candidatus Saccharibacteria bacterium]